MVDTSVKIEIEVDNRDALKKIKEISKAAEEAYGAMYPKDVRLEVKVAYMALGFTIGILGVLTGFALGLITDLI